MRCFPESDQGWKTGGDYNGQLLFHGADKDIQIRFGLENCDRVLVSCEYGTSKTQNLFKVLQDKYRGAEILHIGDDEVSDIEKASANGIDTYQVYSGEELFDALDGLGMESNIATMADRLKTGLFISQMF